jgi:hypothetical protein
VALVDNLKTWRFSSEFFESLITSDEIGGHKLYNGRATRPNFLTTIITVNGASFSKDMAQRSVIVYLKRPRSTADWEAKTRALLRDEREQIIADVRWHLEQEPKAMAKVDRWGSWCGGVLGRVDGADDLLRTIEERRSEVDDDDHDAAAVIEHFREWLRSNDELGSPERLVAMIPSARACEVLRGLKPELTEAQASRFLRNLGHPSLRYHRTGRQRCYRWIGEHADPTQPPVRLIHEASAPHMIRQKPRPAPVPRS